MVLYVTGNSIVVSSGHKNDIPIEKIKQNPHSKIRAALKVFAKKADASPGVKVRLSNCVRQPGNGGIHRGLLFKGQLFEGARERWL